MPILTHSTLRAYTQMYHVKEKLNHSSEDWNRIDRIFMLDLLKYVLKTSVFKFGDWVSTQLHGIAMDTKLASTLYITAIYIDDLKEVFIESQKFQPDVYTNAHMYTCTCVHAWSDTHKCINIYTYMYKQTDSHTHSDKHKWTCTHTHRYTFTPTHSKYNISSVSTLHSLEIGIY